MTGSDYTSMLTTVVGVIIQSLKNDGLIRQIGLRYFLYLGLTGLAFVLGIIPRFLDISILLSSALLGALAFVIGVVCSSSGWPSARITELTGCYKSLQDCFSAGNLKEFFVWSLGFGAIFPRLEGHFAISSAMQIELGAILLVFIISVATQIRLYGLFSTKLSALMRRSADAESANEEAHAARRIEKAMQDDVEKFEHRYSRGFPFSAPPPLHSVDSYGAGVTGSPNFSIHAASLNTPKSESAPLLPELNYVSSAAADRHQRAGQVPSGNTPILTDTTPPVSPPLPTYRRESEVSDGKTSENSDIAREIQDKEAALQEIARIRQRIGSERNSLHLLRGNSLPGAGVGQAVSASVALPESAYTAETGSPAPAHATGHRHSPSLGAMPANRASTYAAPRPISQHSVIVRPVSQSFTPPTVVAHQPRLQRPPAAAHTTSSASIPNIAALSSGPPVSTHQQRTSTGPAPRPPAMVRSQSAATVAATPASGGVQRIVTGVLPSRPSSQNFGGHAAGLASLPRTQTMDIVDLEARHRRRMSELQGSGVGAPGPATAATRPSDTRKRASTLTALNLRKNDASMARAEKRASQADEFGRPLAPAADQERRHQQKRISRRQSAQLDATVSEEKQTTSQPTKTGPAPWLEY